MKAVKDFPNYLLTECGKVYSLNRNRYLTGGLDNDGYRQWVACNKNVRKTLKVHRQVALLYVDNPFNLPVVNHIDGDKENNHYKNLEWCTISHNTKHAYILGQLSQKGERNNSCKYDDETVSKILTGYNGGNIALYAKELGISYGTVYSYIKNLRRV